MGHIKYIEATRVGNGDASIHLLDVKLCKQELYSAPMTM